LVNPKRPSLVAISRGMSRDLIEELCSDHQLKEDKAHYPGPFFPFWTNEIYSLGRCWREFSGWPGFLPLAVSNDHGVQLSEALNTHENTPHPRAHLTWSTWRETPANRNESKKVTRVTHPWVLYRRLKGLTISSSANGTLYFVPHTLPDHIHENPPVAQTLQVLNKRSETLNPIAMIVAMHDVHGGLHKILEKYGHPILTAGHSSSPFFVDRFYAIVRQFQQSVSNSPGSQVFFMEEMGIPTQILGPAAHHPESVRLIYEASGTLRLNRWDEGYRQDPEKNISWRANEAAQALSLDLVESPNRIRRIFLKNLARYLFFQPVVELKPKLRRLPAYFFSKLARTGKPR